jgi:hypothetical protein
MNPITACPLPAGALLQAYVERGAYTDCYVAELPGTIEHAEYVHAFYTSALFKVERLLLRLFLGKPSTDTQVAQLAAGRLDSFAAWSVEGRLANQLMLADFAGRTRSWLMTTAAPGPSAGTGTRLYFGSAVVPRARREDGRDGGRAGMGWPFRVMLGFHKVYSRMLLGAARRRLAAKTARALP